MKKLKSKLIAVAAVAVSITMGASLAGCVTLNEKDVKQVVSTVNLAGSADFKTEFGSYAEAVEPDTVYKRDLIVAFLNAGYSQIEQGYSYAQVFDSLSDALAENAAVLQYATTYLLRSKAEVGTVSLETYKSKRTEKEKYEYLLSESGVKQAKYTLNASLNSALDNYERDVIKAKADESYTGTDTRTTPTGVDTLKEDYVPEGYNVYTGYEGYLLSDAGDDYEPLDRSNRTTRREAYSLFVNYLIKNYLLSEGDKDTTDIYNLTYVQDMYVTQLQQQVITEFSDLFEKDKEELIKTVDGGIYTYVKGKYENLYAEQAASNDETSAFETAMDSMSGTSFVLYSPDTTKDTDEENGTFGTYGYVYNILLPFSAKQNDKLKELQYYRDNSDSITDSNYFADRNQLLKEIKTYDQRSAWFNGTTDYSFDASKTELNYFGKDKGRNYLFFENNLTKKDSYETLDKYYGEYTYNGTVRENKDGSYTLSPVKIDIDGMLNEFVAYVNYVLGGNNASYTVTENYYGTVDFTKNGDKDEIDYSKLVYATGKVTLTDDTDQNMFVKESDRYKAMAAVNELQYAYTTDTGILSRYIGYSVSAYSTNYIKEFEYAAQQALRAGVGTFNVCAGDYGWHLIYVTDTFKCEGGAEYTPVFSKENVEKEGTFENRFYEWIKDSDITNEATLKRSEIVREYVNEDTVKTDKNVYKDLTELGT